MGINKSFFGRMPMQHHSLTNLIQWGTHLSVGDQAIDAQHKAIFDLGTQVHEYWRSGARVDILRPTADKLANLLQGHFAHEEQVLARIGYAGLAEHMAEHRVMLDDLEAMQERLGRFGDGYKSSGGSILAPGWSIMQFMLEFTIGHVMSSDMSYCQSLKASRDSVSGTT